MVDGNTIRTFKITDPETQKVFEVDMTIKEYLAYAQNNALIDAIKRVANR